MKTHVVEKGQWERELEVEVEAERVDRELQRAYRAYQKRLEIPGFRRGKVPLRLIERRYGDSIRSEVIGDLLPTFLEEATRAAGLVPAAPPTISRLEHEKGEPLTFTATLDIWPEIDIGTYENLPATRLVHEVTDEEVEEQLKELQRSHAAERSVERPLQRGDVLIADLQRLDDSGLPIVGEKFEERYFVIGEEDAPSPEFEEALIGIRAGEERRIRFSYRDDLSNRELAGKSEHFLVTAREVRARELPALDDEFARDIGESLSSLEELRQSVRERLEERYQFLAEQRLRAELIGQLIEKNPFELPASMVDNYLESLRQREGGGEGASGEEERARAERALKRHLLIEAVRKKAAIEVTDEELEQLLAARARQMGLAAEDLRRAGRDGDLRRELEEEKVFELLCEKADIKEEKA